MPTGYEDTLNAIKSLAIIQATKRTSVLPVVDGVLTLTATVKYAGTNPEDDSWSDADQGDPWHRILVSVRDGKGRLIDAFYADYTKAEVRPCSPYAPCWWSRADDEPEID